MTALNIDKNRDIALLAGIQSIPTIILYKDGKERNRFIGLQIKLVLEKAIRDVIVQSSHKTP